jgi:predicted phosphodiesterase
MDKELISKLKYLINKKKSLVDICTELELNEHEVIGLVTIMKSHGELVDYVDGEIVKIKNLVNTNEEHFIRDDSDIIKAILISDTHYGNKSDRTDIVNYLYDYADRKGIKYVIHCGDLTDGYYPNRPQQVYELKAKGYDEQLEYVVNKYPKFNGNTYFITGNHDFTHVKNGGGDIGKAINKERPDMIYLGPDTADLKIGKLKIHLHHGGGGKAYALSYKLQKYAETLDQKRPHVFMQGHYHNSMYMYYMGMHCFQCGALLGETQYSRQMGFKNELSVWHMTAYTDKRGEPYAIEPRQEVFTKKLVRIKR